MAPQFLANNNKVQTPFYLSARFKQAGVPPPSWKLLLSCLFPPLEGSLGKEAEHPSFL